MMLFSAADLGKNEKMIKYLSTLIILWLFMQKDSWYLWINGHVDF